MPARPKTTDLAPVEPAQAVTPMDMMNRAIAQGASVEMLEKLMGLQERWEKNQNRIAFENALSAAKAEIPVIIKTQTVDFTSAKGRTNYKYEDLATIAKIVDPILAKHGISYRFRTEASGDRVTVTCIVAGHGEREENSLPAPVDLSGNKNAIQAIGSAITYLQRYTLKASLGLSASADDDGRGGGGNGTIEMDQAKALHDLIEEVKADRAKFCATFGIPHITDLPSAKFEEAMGKLRQFGKQRAAAKAKMKEAAAIRPAPTDEEIELAERMAPYDEDLR